MCRKNRRYKLPQRGRYFASIYINPNGVGGFKQDNENIANVFEMSYLYLYFLPSLFAMLLIPE
jgi:hypothetical protein